MPVVDLHGDLTRVLHADQRMLRVLLVRAHRHEATPQHQHLLMVRDGLGIQVVVVPRLSQRLRRPVLTGQIERLHPHAVTDGVHDQAAPVHDRLETAELRRHRQADVLEPLQALVILVILPVIASRRREALHQLVHEVSLVGGQEFHASSLQKHHIRLSVVSPQPSTRASDAAV